MDYNKVQTLNYSVHAIEQFTEDLKFFEDAFPFTAYSYRCVIDLLKKSVKFIMPNCCEIIHPDELKQSHLDLLKLPFPIIAFEASWIKDVSDIGEIDFIGKGVGVSTKRIALCVESSILNEEFLPELTSLLKHAPDGGVFVIPIYWQQERWTLGGGGSFIYYKNKILNTLDQNSLPLASQMLKKVLLDANAVSPKTKSFKAEPFVLLPEFCERMLISSGSEENVKAQIMADSRDEVMMLIQACAVLNCANITTSEIPAPIKLNKKRLKNGKLPFFSYHVLQVSADKNHKAYRGAGTHASPRMHLRRGHFRRLDEKTIWINPTMINSESKQGMVLKDYTIKPD